MFEKYIKYGFITWKDEEVRMNIKMVWKKMEVYL